MAQLHVVDSSQELFAHLPSGIDVCHQTFGDPGDPAVVLVMGLGAPMGLWQETFCRLLASRGHFVIRYDNRDTGRSTKLRHREVSTGQLLRAYLRGGGDAPYGLTDFAEDLGGLLDHLDVAAAHVVGASMGGMIAQTFAIDQPDRTLSLTSIMSTTGRRTVGWLHPKLVPVMLRGGANTLPAFVERQVDGARRCGSPAFPTPVEQLRATATQTYERGWIASGVSRHMLAVLTQPDRTEALGNLTMPALVVHGGSDLMVHRSGGRATAAAIPDAEYLEIAGMGHDLPEQLNDPIIDAITATTHRAR